MQRIVPYVLLGISTSIVAYVFDLTWAQDWSISFVLVSMMIAIDLWSGRKHEV